VKLTVAGPTDRTDVLLARARPAKGAKGVELYLERTIGSMNELFKAPPGVLLGTITLSGGKAERLDLGPGLLPSDVGERSAQRLDVQ
jgi:hypothetical protein